MCRVQDLGFGVKEKGIGLPNVGNLNVKAVVRFAAVGVQRKSWQTTFLD